MSRLVFDIEGDGLLKTVTQIWCIVTQDADTGEVKRYPCACAAVMAGIEALKNADCLIGHNIIAYDLKAIWKLHGEWEKVPLIVDTLVVSRGLWPERSDGHSLEAWGKRLGFPKIDFNDYTKYTEEMLAYCEQDVALNVKVLKALEEEHGATFTGYKVY